MSMLLKPFRRLLSTTHTTLTQFPFLSELGLLDRNLGCYNGKWHGGGESITSVSPSSHEPIAEVQLGTIDHYHDCIRLMDQAKADWASLPAPARGEVVRKIANALRKKKSALGALVSLEMGKIVQEGNGEVQEAIDICDYAVGLSRCLNGSVIPSERPGHFMMERYNPLKGHLGIITAFNFPVAVLFWNAALSLIAGNCQIWKGASTCPLVSIACTKIIANVLEDEGLPGALACMILGPGRTVGDAIINDPKIELVSFTGSTETGRNVSKVVAQRFGKTILELGGNNAMVVMDDADMELALRAVVFSAVGTAGQRCTSLRRLYLHQSIHDSFLTRLKKAYSSIVVGNPLDDGVLCGPLHTKSAVEDFKNGIKQVTSCGGEIIHGGDVLDMPGNFVQPTLASVPTTAACVQEELFGPLLYVMPFKDLTEAISLNNNVRQGLSSSLFTTSQQNVFRWTGALGSDCGIVNVNIGTSGAEIGGAFGGEKETGGGRESGSDSWKQYMRRSTCTINHSNELPLAQGIDFPS
uniref:aldehyde dehydrogenase (NAD(+)) n=2 Tax=Hirondellea gigas TaxID=1518452 RepID=A0A6A7G362_9CRUS